MIGMNVKRILCPLDFSDASTHALEQAARLARWYGAGLTVLHVRPTVVPHPDISPEGHMAPWLVAELETLRHRVTAACADAVAAGVPVDAMASAGDPVHEILRHADTLAADLIVLGTHGLSGFRHLVLGSVTEKVLRRATCPVLTVPPHASAARWQFTRILCAVDFSDCSQHAVTFAATLARQAAATLSLLHVIDWPWHESAIPETVGVSVAQAQAMADYRRYLETGAAERLAAIGAAAMPDRQVSTSVSFGKPYVELLDAARRTGADLIVLGVRGRGPVDLGFFGSTANHVVRSATCPVLTVRG
jgi:nucleotide-binding universal stress UspA family protein